VDVIMPPTIGAAIGFITSEPTPVSHRMGMRLASTTDTVISFGRNGFIWRPKASVVTLALRNRRASAEATRCVAIDLLGRAAVQRIGAGDCA